MKTEKHPVNSFAFSPPSIEKFLSSLHLFIFFTFSLCQWWRSSLHHGMKDGQLLSPYIYSKFLAFSTRNKEVLSIMPFLIKNEENSSYNQFPYFLDECSVISEFICFVLIFVDRKWRSSSVHICNFLPLSIGNEESLHSLHLFRLLYQSGSKNFTS